MLIKEIKIYLFNKKNESVTLNKICFQLKQDKEIVLHALHFLIQKGLVKEEVLEMPCKGCFCNNSCNQKDKMVYKFGIVLKALFNFVDLRK